MSTMDTDSGAVAHVNLTNVRLSLYRELLWCVYVLMHVRLYAFMYVCMYICMRVCMSVCPYLSKYECMYLPAVKKDYRNLRYYFSKVKCNSLKIKYC